MYVNFFHGINRKIFLAPASNLSLKTPVVARLITKRSIENKVSSSKLAVLARSNFWKSRSCEYVCLAIYGASLNNNRYTKCTKIHFY